MEGNREEPYQNKAKNPEPIAFHETFGWGSAYPFWGVKRDRSGRTIEEDGEGYGSGQHWWGILFGGTLFWNLTMIGSAANIVAIGIIGRQKIGHITFGQWNKPGAIISIITLAIATLIIYL